MNELLCYNIIISMLELICVSICFPTEYTKNLNQHFKHCITNLEEKTFVFSILIYCAYRCRSSWEHRPQIFFSVSVGDPNSVKWNKMCPCWSKIVVRKCIINLRKYDRHVLMWAVSLSSLLSVIVPQPPWWPTTILHHDDFLRE